MPGLFISFEGGEGAGKSTQARLLQEHLAAEGRHVVLVHEPGGTKLGVYLRDWLKAGNRPMTAEAELFLFVAARSELVRRVIGPELEDGAIVIADRYADSTVAYQGYGRQLPLQVVNSANALATGRLWPDITFLLDADPVETLARARMQKSFETDAGLDFSDRLPEGEKQRFEQASIPFHKRVREAFLNLARREPQRWVVLNGLEEPGAIAERVKAYTHQRLGKGESPGPENQPRLL